MNRTPKGVVVTDGRTLGPVHVSIPVSVAYDFDKFVKIQRSILERLGCSACTSGHDIRFDIHQNFAVDEKLNITEVVHGLR